MIIPSFNPVSPRFRWLIIPLALLILLVFVAVAAADLPPISKSAMKSRTLIVTGDAAEDRRDMRNSTDPNSSFFINSIWAGKCKRNQINPSTGRCRAEFEISHYVFPFLELCEGTVRWRLREVPVILGGTILVIERFGKLRWQCDNILEA